MGSLEDEKGFDWLIDQQYEQSEQSFTLAFGVGISVAFCQEFCDGVES